MLKGFFMVLMIAASYGVLYLIYGKKGMELREIKGKKNFGLCIPIALVLIFWALALAIWIEGDANDDKTLCIIITFAVPVLFGVLAFITRKRTKKAWEEYEKEEKAAETGAVKWICPMCGKENSYLFETCECGEKRPN